MCVDIILAPRVADQPLRSFIAQRGVHVGLRSAWRNGSLHDRVVDEVNKTICSARHTQYTTMRTLVCVPVICPQVPI